MRVEGQMRGAYYLRVSTESQELDNQRTEILPIIDRRGWKLVHTFEDVMSGQRARKIVLVLQRCLRQLIKGSSTF
jgi:DNA invertase Pin-like site-specific DNA recombinase